MGRQHGFGQIRQEVGSKHGGFHFFPQKGQNNPQKLTNSEIIQDVIQNGRRNWRLDEIVVGYNNRGETIEEMVLIHNTVRLEDYEVGEFDGHRIYRANRFNPTEIEQIKKVLLGTSTFGSASSKHYSTVSSQSLSVDNKNRNIGDGMLFSVVGVASLITIISVVVIRKYYKSKKIRD